jgi:hypothetical protein
VEILMKFAVLFTCVAFAAPALAQQAAPAPAATPSTEAKPDKKVCRMIDTTGSIMGKRECHTKDEWRQISDANADRAARTLDDRPRSSAAGNMGAN